MISSPSIEVSGANFLSPEDLKMLRRYTSPTIANAIEVLGVTPEQATYTNAGVHCLFPDLGPMVGYACTTTIRSAQAASHPRRVRRTEYWEYTRSSPAPRVTVVQDLSDQPGGAYWGEVNANIHRALGSLGVITNGTVRDVEEVSSLGFHFFASGVQVSHGHAHLEDFNRSVKVFDMVVNPGDMVHADRHGAVVIPHDLIRLVLKAAREIESRERPMIELCKSPDFSIDELDKLIPSTY